MSKIKLTPLRTVFIFEVIVVFLVALGLVSREGALLILGIFIFYILFSPLEDGLILFIASIPIFLALPLTDTFDSLSSARVIILVLFLKWLFLKRKELWLNIKSLTIKKVLKDYRLELFTIILFIIMALSIMNAMDVISAIKRIVYLANLIIIFPVIKYFVIREEYFSKRIIKAIIISFGLVFLIALGQLVSVYFSTIGGFWDWWADHFSYGFYGENLRQIVKNMNAWFAYSPAGPSVIRLFGSFTDPHSFALYLLLTSPFLFIFIFPIFDMEKISWREFRKIKSPIKIGLLILTLFFIILSGTRGIWISSIFGIIAIIYLFLLKKDLYRSVSFILLTILIFIIFIPISSVFTVIPQFREQEAGETDVVLFLKRLTSILDIDEKSNQGRIYIWKMSLESIKKEPWLGVGAGNFPVVLFQDVGLAKAGSSAHNLYLNFAVESGIFSFVIVVLIFLEILLTTLFLIRSNLSPKIRLLITGIFVYLIWVFAYSFVDIALLDERVFLLFLTILGLVYGLKNRFHQYSDL